MSKVYLIIRAICSYPSEVLGTYQDKKVAELQMEIFKTEWFSAEDKNRKWFSESGLPGSRMAQYANFWIKEMDLI